MRILFLVTLSFWFLTTATAQTGVAKRALKLQLKGKIEKAGKLMNKSLAKDENLPAGLFAKASLQFDSSFQHYNLDSAYASIMMARTHYAKLDDKAMHKHMKVGFDLVAINQLKKQIEMAAYNRAKQIMTEEAFIYYLDYFETSEWQQKAMAKRDSLAFETAKQLNTYQSYEAFMAKYPQSAQMEEAKRRYERLFFLKSTADGKLSSYEQFLEQHPTTPYRIEAEQSIFEISTADANPASFKMFINKFPKSAHLPRAKRLLYHILKAYQDVETIKGNWLSDSLLQAQQLEMHGALIPTLKMRKYGFNNLKGEEVIPAKYEYLIKQHLCELLEKDYFLLDKSIVGRNGKIIYNIEFDEVDDLGCGFLKIKRGDMVQVIHKSGWPLSKQMLQDAKILNNTFMAYRLGKKWGLLTLTGKVLFTAQFDSIYALGQFFIFEKENQYDVSNAEQIARILDKEQVSFQARYNDFELINDTKIKLYTSLGQTVLDENLKVVIPFNLQEIVMNNDKILIKKGAITEILDQDFNSSTTIGTADFQQNNLFLLYQKETKWALSKWSDLNSEILLDSAKLLGTNMAFGMRNDSLWLFFDSVQMLLKKDIVSIELLTANKASAYLKITDGKRKKTSYINSNGFELLSGEFDEVTPIGKEYLIVSKRGKKGLIYKDGSQLLAPKYDAIANYNNGYLSFLDNKKFGLINGNLKTNIDAAYERNLVPYNDTLVMAFKDNKYGLVYNNGTLASDFQFDEIQYWNDSLALVKTNFQWKFLAIAQNTLSEIGFKSIQETANQKGERIIIALADTGYGVFGNRRGEIISPTFNDIINLGTKENPIYFTEKHVEEAEFYVVIYYNAAGELIMKSAYEAADYTLLYCEQ